MESAEDSLARVTDGDHAPLTFSRDGLGREVRRESGAGFKLDQAYDRVGQLLKQSAGIAIKPGIAGAAAAQKAGVSLNPTAERSFAWNKAFAPLSIKDRDWGALAYRYDGNGQIVQTDFGDGGGEGFSYDAALNTSGFAEGPAPAAPSQRIRDYRAGAGHVEPDRDAGRFQGWRLSEGGRVQQATGPNGETVRLDHDIRGRVIARRVERDGFRPKRWIYGWDAKDRLVSCKTPDNETWRYGYDPFGRRVWKVKEFTEAEAQAYARRFPRLIDAARLPERGATLAMGQRSRLDRDGVGEADRPPVVGVAWNWDGNVIAEEAPLRLDGGVDWDRATRWHYEPGGFRPLAKETAEGELLYIVTNHLGTPREMFGEDGKLRWAAEYRTWGDIRRLWKPDAANDNAEAPRAPPAPRYSTRWDRLEQEDGERPAGRPEPPRHSGPAGGRVYGALALKDETAFAEARLECPIRFQGQYE